MGDLASSALGELVCKEVIDEKDAAENVHNMLVLQEQVKMELINKKSYKLCWPDASLSKNDSNSSFYLI